MVDDLLLSTDEKIRHLKNLPIEYLHKVNPPTQRVNDDLFELKQSIYRRNDDRTSLNMHFCGIAEPIPVKRSKTVGKYSYALNRYALIEYENSAPPAPTNESNKYISLAL